jgi:arabinose-5-phosphate isomerase
MPPGMHDRILQAGRRVVEAEAAAVGELAGRLDDEFVRAVERLLALKGRVVASGVGKSGQVARRAAATLTSTGTPAFFLHPVEALHGDLGLVREGDVALIFSYSGTTVEVLELYPLFRRMDLFLIALTGAPESPVATKADLVLNCRVREEACPNNLAPTSSAMATAAMADALAMALVEARGFSQDDFAQFHPGGSLGRRLLLRARELMHAGAEMPQVNASTPMRQALLEITGKRLGCAVVVDEEGRLLGIFTDGDLRRLSQAREDFLDLAIGTVMGKSPKTIEGDALATAALARMEEHAITQLVVLDSERRPEGVLHLHDLLKAGIA